MVRVQTTKKFKMNQQFQQEQKISFKFDIGMMNSFIGYLFKDNTRQITRKTLLNMKKLFDIIDETPYESDEKLYERLYIIRRALKARVELGMENEGVIINFCRSENASNKLNEEILNNIPQYKKLNYNEVAHINRAVEDRLKYAFLMTYKDPLYEQVERLDSGDYDSYREINNEMLKIMKNFIGETQKVNVVDEVPTFSFGEEDLLSKVDEIVTRLKDPARILKTGIQQLNNILSPGYLGKRLYIYMGLPAGFKSGIMLKSALDIKAFNRDTPMKNPTARRTILFVTMENDVEETFERLFNMAITTKDIRDFTPKQVMKQLSEGGLTLGADEDIDLIIKYYPNRSISTDDLYTIIDDLENDNKEVITLILDYIKRIRPAERAKDEKEELKNITNELKTLATNHNIPVITAHQLNRSAASVVDSAMESSQEDVGRFVGRSHVGTAWEVMENADWACIINTEMKRETGQWYLTFKRVKLRYRDIQENPITYFNHPFVMGDRIQLMTDIHLDAPLSETSLTSDFVAIELDKKGKRNATKREVIQDLTTATANDLFDFASASNKNK